MSVVVVGLNHRSAPLHLLERLAISPVDTGKALSRLALRDNISEVVVLSTCMRTEVYAVAERFHGAIGDIVDFLADVAGVDCAELEGHSYNFYDSAAITHLFRVAAGLDSAVLGEGEVLGQVREAWEISMREKTSGATLNAFFRHGLEVGKRARSETSIARGITSVPQAGIAMASRETDISTSQADVVIVGAGAIGTSLALTVSQDWAPARLAVASRALESAENLCAELSQRGYLDASPQTLDAIRTLVGRADLIFCATASTEHVIGLDDVKHALAFRQGRPLVIVDLGVPRDVDPAIGSLDGVKLLDIDSVRDYVDLEMSARVAEVAKVNAIIEEEVARYLGDSTSRQVAPLVASLRERLEEIRLSELSKAARRLGTLDDSQRTAVESLTKAIIAKALHEPTIRLKSAAGTPRGERLSDSLRELFDLR